MDMYRKVQTLKPETPISENEIRITSQGQIRNYITYATTLLEEKPGREIVLKAMGHAINKTVAIAEIMRREIPELHQDTAISSERIVDLYEPIEEGLLPVETSRNVSMISITLSTNELNKNSPGYQAPANVDQSRPQRNYQQRPRQARPTYNVVSEDSYGRGRGRARGRGRERGWNRGGYGNYQGDYQGNYQGNSQGDYDEGRNYQGNYQRNNYQENGGNPNWGRGAGYGYRGNGYGRGGRGGGGGGGRGYGGNRGRRGSGYARGGGNQE